MILREVPGLPPADVRPPIVAESGDPFAELRVTHLLARIPRGTPVRIRDVVDQLNREHLDWSFSRRVVIGAAIQLQANWLTDYRNSSGIVLQDGLAGTVGLGFPCGRIGHGVKMPTPVDKFKRRA